MKYILFFFLFFVSISSYAQDVIKILVGFPPGGGNYILGQLVAESFERQGLKAIIESKPGAGGILAMNECVTRNSEKNLLCLVSQTQYVHSIYLPNDIRRFDPEKISYIKLVGATPLVLVSNKDNQKSLQEIINDLKDKNKRNLFGASSVGLQITTNWFLQQVKSTNSDIINYKGGSQVNADLMGNHINYTIGFYAGNKQLAEQGTIRIVSLIGEHFNDSDLLKYAKLQKFVPTMEENTQKFGFVRGEGTDKTTINNLTMLLNRVLEDVTFKEKAKKEGFFLYSNNLTGDDFKKMAAKEREIYSSQIKAMPL